MKTRLRIKNKAGNTLPPLSDIPILIPDAALAAIKGDEAEPYELVEAIPFPSDGTGGIYTRGYFESLLEYMKVKPIGGSKIGPHKNENDDFFTIGGKIENTSENEGVCYLRIMVPAEGYETTNSGFIRSCKTGNQEFSIVANVEALRNTQGQVIYTRETGKPRNDAVSEGAMPQMVSNSASEKEILDLISTGKVDFDTDSDELVQNGVVYRRAAVKLQSDGEKGTMAGHILGAITRLKDRKEKNQVTKQEIIDAAKAAITNNELTLEELAEALKMDNKLRNATDEQRAKLAAAIAEALELPPDTPAEELIKAVTEALKEAETAAEAVAEIEANSLAGSRKIKNADGSEADNPAYLYAKDKLTGLRGLKLKNAAEAMKKDLVMLSLRSRQADGRPEDIPAAGGKAPAFREV
jgi:hypothetical protein